MSKKELSEKKRSEAADTAEAADKPVKKLNGRWFKYSSMFYVTIALVIAIVVVLNIMVGMLSKRSPIKIDLTPDGRYDLTDESIEALKAIDKDIEVTVTSKKEYFASLGNYMETMYAQNYGVKTEVPYEMIPELLDKYSVYAEQSNGSISVKYVDMDVDPDIINKYKKNYSGDIGSGSIIVSSGDRVRVISEAEVRNMLLADQNALSNNELRFNFTGESLLTSAIISVTDAAPVRVAFANTMNGALLYDEQLYYDAVNSFKNELLTKSGYECVDFDISADELDPLMYDMVVVIAPSVDFTDNIIKKLSDFLYNGGQYGKHMIYAPDFSKSGFKNIDSFLADYSIKVEDRIVNDETESNTVQFMDYMGNHYGIKINVSDETAVGELPNDKLPLIAEYPRELSQIKKNNDDIVSEIFKSCDESYSVEIYDSSAKKSESGAKTIAMLSRREAQGEHGTVSSDLLVLGSALMAGETYIQQNTTFNNASVLIGTINNMTGKENSLIVPDKNIQSAFIAPTEKQASVIRVIVMWVIPFIVVAVGAFVLLRRRNK